MCVNVWHATTVCKTINTVPFSLIQINNNNGVRAISIETV